MRFVFTNTSIETSVIGADNRRSSKLARGSNAVGEENCGDVQLVIAFGQVGHVPQLRYTLRSVHSYL